MSTSVTVFSFAPFLGLTVSPIGYFLIPEVSGVLFISFLQVIQGLSGVTLAKSYLFQDKRETFTLSL